MGVTHGLWGLTGQPTPVSNLDPESGSSHFEHADEALGGCYNTVTALRLTSPGLGPPWRQRLVGNPISQSRPRFKGQPQGSAAQRQGSGYPHQKGGR